MSVLDTKWCKVYISGTWPGDWELIDGFEVLSVRHCVAPEVSEARLLYHYGAVKLQANAIFGYTPTFNVQDYYLRITLSDDVTHIFYGIVPAQQQRLDATRATAEHGDIEITAYGLEHLLDRAHIYGAWTKPVDTVDGEPEVNIDWCPTFNKRHARGEQTLGNRSAHLGASGVYAFAENMDSRTVPDTSPKWSHLQIVQYLLEHYAQNDALGLRWELADDNAATAACLSMENIYTIQDLEGLKLRDALNRLIFRGWGLGYRVWPAFDGRPTIRVFTYFENDFKVGAVTLPGNQNRKEITVTNAVDPGAADEYSNRVDGAMIRRSSAAVFDTIVVEGARAVTCFSLGYPDGNLGAGWSATQQSTYLTAVTAGTMDVDVVANDAYRGTDPLADVFACYQTPSGWDGGVGNGIGGLPKTTAFPSVNDDGTYDTTTAKFGGRVGKVFLRHLPLMKNWDYATGAWAGHATREPEYLAPMAFVYDSKATVPRWILVENADSLSDTDYARAQARVRPDDSMLAMHVKFSPNHILADNHWAGANPSAHEPTGTTRDDWAVDWQTMILTVALETDSRLRIVKTGLSPKPSGRTLVIPISSAKLWLMARGTVFGIAAAGTLQRAQAWTVLRNDLDALRIIAELAVKWYGKERYALAYSSPDMANYYVPGTYLTAIAGAAFPDNVKGVVTGVLYDGRKLTATTQTEFIDLDFVTLGPGLLGIGNDSISGKDDMIRTLQKTARRVQDLEVHTGNMVARESPPAPFRRQIIRFDGACMIDEADPAATHSNTWTAAADGPSPVLMNTAQYVLVHFDSPVKPCEDDDFSVAVGCNLVVTWTDLAAQTSIEVGPAFTVTAVTQDFDFDGSACATWTTRPSTGTTFTPTSGGITGHLRSTFTGATTGTATFTTQPVAADFGAYGAGAETSATYGLMISCETPYVASPLTAPWAQTITVGSGGLTLTGA